MGSKAKQAKNFKAVRKYRTIWLFDLLVDMRKYNLITAALLITFVSGSCTRSSSVEKKNNQSPQPPNDLPSMTITKLDGSEVDVRALKGKMVLILFQPDCDHCQREAKEIREHIDAFKEYAIYFISADQLPAVEKFGNDSDLLNRNNIHLH